MIGYGAVVIFLKKIVFLIGRYPIIQLHERTQI